MNCYVEEAGDFVSRDNLSSLISTGVNLDRHHGSEVGKLDEDNA